MKTFDERKKELVSIILNTRDFCGNEAEAIRDYFAEEGFPSGFSLEKERLRMAAIESAQVQWDRDRFR